MDAETLRNELLTSQWYGFSPGNIGYTGGNVGIGTNNPVYALDIVDQNNALCRITEYNSTDGPVIRAYRALGTIASPTGVTTDTCLFAARAFGYNSSAAFSGRCVGIEMNAAETFTSSATGTYMGFHTCASGTTTNSEKMRILGNGNVGINSSVPGTTLDVGGIGRFTTVTTGGWLLLALSTASYAVGLQNLVWTSIANSRIVLNANGIQFNIPDAGVYIINLQLNADTSVTGNITVGLYTVAGVNLQNSEWNTTWTTSVETRCQFFINNTTSTDYKFMVNNGTAGAFAFSNIVLWSRASIFKIG